MKSGHAGLPRTTLLVYDLYQRVAKIPITPLYGNWIIFMGLFWVLSMIRKNGLKMVGGLGRTAPYYGACFTNGVEDWSKTSIMWSTMVKWLKSSILKKLLCFGMWHITNHLTKCTSNWLTITDREFLQYKSLITRVDIMLKSEFSQKSKIWKTDLKLNASGTARTVRDTCSW